MQVFDSVQDGADYVDRSMNRRRLILTTFGALAGVLGGVKGASLVSAAPLAPVPQPAAAELFVSVGCDASKAVAGLAALGEQLDIIINTQREKDIFIQQVAEAIAESNGRRNA